MDYKTFFNELVTFDTYIEFRILNFQTEDKNKKSFSIYAKNMNDVDNIFKHYDKPPYTIYYGINSRKIKGMYDVDVESRRIFFFDIEHANEKPQFTDKQYVSDLYTTADYISSKLFDEYKIKPVALVCSGRGVHLYYGINPRMDREKYGTKFKAWFKFKVNELYQNRPIEHIKFNDPMQNISRIASCPGTHHNKYDERPERIILQYDISNLTDQMPSILDEFVVPVYKPKEKVVISSGKKRLYNEKTIFNAPEFKVFELGVPANKGMGINNRLRLALSLLMDKYNIQNRDEVNYRLVALGYSDKGVPRIENSEYVYTESLLNNWVMDFWEFCLDKNFLLPYPVWYSNSIEFMIRNNNYVDSRTIDLKSPRMIIDYIKEWNNTTMKKVGDREVYFYEDMKKNVMSKITNPKLRTWVEQNKFLDKVKLVK